MLLRSVECLGPVLSIVPCLWECSAKHSAYITSLQENLNSLKNSMDELNNLSQDVKNRVEQAEEQQLVKRTNEVNGWLQRVEAVEKEVNQILQKGARELENKCPKNCGSSYKLGKKVMKMIAQVTGLTEKGRFDGVADQMSVPPVDEQPMDNVVVGFESKFEEVWQSIQNKDSNIIGLVGMGGVGKTTLLKQVNNEFLKATYEYDLVIWIVVSRPVNLERIRDTLRSKLNIQDDLWLNRSEDQRVSLIFNKLKKKKFVVLLDDVWEGLELSDVGIPQPGRDKMCRVVFTTRSREVCQSMDANKIIEVGCLPPDQAFSLFCSKVGEDMLKHHQEIKRLVKDVAGECQGLPLALITIGRAMRGTTEAQEWKDAKRALEKYPSTFPGMEGRVYSKLVFSYEAKMNYSSVRKQLVTCMECLSQGLSIVPCLWECCNKHSAYITNLEDNLSTLQTAMGELNNLGRDVKNRVEVAEEQQMKPTNQVNGWLQRVDAVEQEVNQVQRKGTQESEYKCGTNCRSKYKLGKKVMKMIPRVTKLTEEGQFDVVAHQLPPPQVEEQPMDNVVVGFESKLEEVWQSVRNNDSSVIGLVGMGGVGKTTLLKQLNNKFLKATHTYDMVIWIVVSKTTNVGKIQGALRSKLNIPDHLWVNKSEDQRDCQIFNVLKKKKFVVLLDDMWETFELSEVGIPRPNMDNMSKIVFTTRSREVCRSMGADKVIPVGCLPPDQAFTLFYSQLGEEDILKSHPYMRGLITNVASECEGLPLALITIGRAMRGKADARQWKEAKRTLKKYPSTFPGMKGVFSKLVFSYDSLPNPMIKKCFEYCSLYPEDHKILEEEVIKLWLAEGFIGEYDSMYDALIQGRQIMESLKQACLLETGEMSIRYFREDETIKMHDMIRDMALWVACEQGEKKGKFYVEVASGDHEGITLARNAMSNIEKISLRGTGISTESLAGMSFCPDLSTLIIQRSKVKELPGEVVHSMNVLKVLDLSDNRGLIGLPIKKGCLTNLEYLNIVRTQVRLPGEVSQWRKLKFLIVDDVIVIPREIISSLCSLQMLEQISLKWGSIDISRERKSMEGEMLSELEGLKHIMDIRLVLNSAMGIRTLLGSPKLQRCTTRLAVKQVESLSDTLDFGAETLTKHLERLDVHFCEMSEITLGRPSLYNNLCEVSFYCCDELLNLNSLIYVPNLCILHVYMCMSMSELIVEETRSSNVGTSLFSCLTSLNLCLPRLRSICPQSALPFPSLKFMRVSQCGSLTKLPFDSNTVSTIAQDFKIKGERRWWDGLEWDSQETKDAFTPKFIVLQL